MSWIIYDRNRIYPPTKQCTHTLCSWWRKPDQPKHITLWNFRIDSLCKPNKFAKPYTILCGIYIRSVVSVSIYVYVFIRILPHWRPLLRPPLFCYPQNPPSHSHTKCPPPETDMNDDAERTIQSTHTNTHRHLSIWCKSEIRVYTRTHAREKKESRKLTVRGRTKQLYP